MGSPPMGSPPAMAQMKGGQPMPATGTMPSMPPMGSMPTPPMKGGARMHHRNGTRKNKNKNKNMRGGSTNNNNNKNMNMKETMMGGASMPAVGSKASVFHGHAKHTSGGLTKRDLMKTKHGRIVSRKKHALGKKALKNLVKAGYKAKKGTFKLFRK